MVEIVAKGPVKSRKRKGWKSYYVSTRHREIKKTNGSKGELKWFHTLAEAQAAAHQFNAAQYTSGVVTDSEAGTIGALVDMEIARYEQLDFEGSIVYGTFVNAKRQLQNIKTVFGANAKASTITQENVEHVIAADPRTDAVRKSFLKRIRALFDDACDLGWATKNPARKVKIKRRAVFKFLLNQDETKTNKSYGPGTWPVGLAVVFHALTGLRPQEVVAIRWKAVDFVSDKVAVATAKTSSRTGPCIGATKTKKGVRSLPLGPVLQPLLKAWRLRSPFAGDDDFLFPTRQGAMYNRYKVWTKTLQRACKELGLKHMTLYTLRHLHASLLLQELGENWFEIADRMGHADANFTRTRYGHHVDDRKKPKQNVVGSVLFDHVEPAPEPPTNQVVQFKLKS